MRLKGLRASGKDPGPDLLGDILRGLLGCDSQEGRVLLDAIAQEGVPDQRSFRRDHELYFG